MKTIWHLCTAWHFCRRRPKSPTDKAFVPIRCGLRWPLATVLSTAARVSTSSYLHFLEHTLLMLFKTDFYFRQVSYAMAIKVFFHKLSLCKEVIPVACFVFYCFSSCSCIYSPMVSHHPWWSNARSHCGLILQSSPQMGARRWSLAHFSLRHRMWPRYWHDLLWKIMTKVNVSNGKNPVPGVSEENQPTKENSMEGWVMQCSLVSSTMSSLSSNRSAH